MNVELGNLVFGGEALRKPCTYYGKIVTSAKAEWINWRMFNLSLAMCGRKRCI